MYEATLEFQGLDGMSHTSTMTFDTPQELAKKVVFLEERGASSLSLVETNWDGDLEVLESLIF